jgi:hypothetical protein
MHGTGSVPGTQDGAPSGQQEEVSRNARTQRMRTVTLHYKTFDSFLALIRIIDTISEVHSMEQMQV